MNTELFKETEIKARKQQKEIDELLEMLENF